MINKSNLLILAGIVVLIFLVNTEASITWPTVSEIHVVQEIRPSILPDRQTVIFADGGQADTYNSVAQALKPGNTYLFEIKKYPPGIPYRFIMIYMNVPAGTTLEDLNGR